MPFASLPFLKTVSKPLVFHVTPLLHPAVLGIESLLAQCDVRRQRRSGPGGQHRNKVETAIVVTHQPSGLRGEASERRSQLANQKMAIHRLRVKLALEIRSVTDDTLAVEIPRSLLWQSRLQGKQITVSASHPDFPPLLVEALDVVFACQFDCKLAAGQLGCSASQLVKLLKLEPAALLQVNAHRAARNLNPLQ